MNVEVFSYSIMASILGISIVFLSLVLLSLLMVALKAVFGDREKKPEAVEAVPRAAAEGAVSAVKRENHDWIMAAVGAFLAMEEAGAPRAESWVPGAAEITDPWMNRAAFDRNIG